MAMLLADMARQPMVGVEDLVMLTNMNDKGIVENLKKRFEADLIYTSIGTVLISVNPFKRIPQYGPDKIEFYQRHGKTSTTPHIFGLAEETYRTMILEEENQCVIISGESGAGKTEAAKQIMLYVAAVSGDSEQMKRVKEIILESNPLLEAFGNAKTVRNDNSSRFGKYVKLLFDPTSGIMIGAGMETYLLEKSRVCRVGQGERSYHVFYEMLAGLSADDKRRLGGLRNPQDYPSLSRGGTLTRRGVDGRDLNDADEFTILCRAMEKMGMSRDLQWSIWTILAAILHLLDMTFSADANDKAQIANGAPFDTACDLLKVDAKLLAPCFLVKSKTKILTTLCSVAEAEMLRDSFCKALYVGVFDHIVAIVNKAVAPTVNVANARYIGILDIFGFENFKVNSFEQLCINFANESLQNHYNKYTFVNDEAECRAEGIEFPPVVFPDNTECLAMFDQAKTGVFALLDEACYFRGATHETFTENVWQQWTGKSAHFIRPKSSKPDAFGVRHYASDVTYNTPEWLEKNSDPLKEEAKSVLGANKLPNGEAQAFVGNLLENADCQPSDGQARKRTSVSSRFRQQLAALRGELESTETHFVRCIKPNMEAKPGLLDNGHVSSQLESAGVLQTIAVKRQGFPARRELAPFARFFHSIAPRDAIKRMLAANDYAAASRLILDLYVRVFGWTAPHYAVGRTKVFMKSHIWGALERTLLRRNRMRMRRVVPLLSAWARRFRAKKEEQARKAREAAVQQQRSQVDIGTDKFTWFEELCRVFPRMDPTIVYDVVGHMPTKQGAARALSEMRAAQFDQHVPANMRLLLERAHVAPEAVKKLIEAGVDNLEKLYGLNDAKMTEIGLSDSHRKHITEVIVQQSSLAVRNSCLLASGTGELPEVSDAQLKKLAEAEEQARTVRDRVHQLAALLGCDPGLAARALRAANGNDSLAASMIMDGTVPAAGGSSPPPANAAPANPSQPPTASVPVPSSRPPANRPPPPASRPRGPSQTGGAPPPPPPSHPPPPGGDVPSDWQANLNRLTNEMGFPRDAAIDALRRTGGDIRAATAHLLGA